MESSLKIVAFFALFVLCINGIAQSSSTFELRYFTNDPKANGETDFKGETEWFDTEKRVSFLNEYADFASRYFDNPGLDKKIVTDKEISHLLGEVKPQPETNVRKTIWLNGWKTYGYKEGQDIQKERELERWNKTPGAQIENGKLKLNNTTIKREFDPLTWRFKLKFNVISSDDKSHLILELKENDKTVVSLTLNSVCP